MDQNAMSHNSAPETLAAFLRRWRGQRGISEMARQAGFSVHSIWSKLEAGQPPSLETLILLAHHTGRDIEELAAMAGMPVRRSASDRDRSDRVDRMIAAVPKSAVLVDLLSELTPSEVDTLLTVAEGMIRGREDRR
jgi:transcriptional regulator with XRE-family HTH domain